MKGKMLKQILLVLMVINTFSGSLEDQLFTALDQKNAAKKVRELIKAGANIWFHFINPYHITLR